MSSLIINIGIYDGLLTPGVLKSGTWVPSADKYAYFILRFEAHFISVGTFCLFRLHAASKEKGVSRK